MTKEYFEEVMYSVLEESGIRTYCLYCINHCKKKESQSYKVTEGELGLGVCECQCTGSKAEIIALMNHLEEIKLDEKEERLYNEEIQMSNLLIRLMERLERIAEGSKLSIGY